jgi:class 3 adenylate cyclase
LVSPFLEDRRLERLVDHTTGDGFFAVFSSVNDGVAAVIEMQLPLGAHDWPASERVGVRMGSHSGEATETPAGLVGLDMHHAARVAGVAHARGHQGS